MKVLVVTHTLSRSAGGLFYSVRELSENISNLPNIDLEVIGLEDIFFDEDIPNWINVKTKSFKKLNFLSKFGFSFSFLFYVLKAKPDIIHLHGIWNFASFVIFLKSFFFKGAIVISPRGMLDKWILKKGYLKKMLYWNLIEKHLLQRASCIHCLNDSEKISVLEVLPSVKTKVLPNGVQQLPPYSYNQLNLKSKKMIFLSRIDSKKGVMELVKAWNSMENLYDWTLEIYGWGDSEYLSKVKSCISNQVAVKIFGPVYGQQKIDVLKSASAFILPSYSEGLPMAVLEAWSYGIPVLMTQECNIPIGFTSGAAIQIHLDTLANDLTTFLQLSSEELERLSVISRELVAENFLWKNISTEMVELYRTI